MKGRAITYSAEEMAWLKANRKMVISDYAVAFNERFRRDVSAANLHALRKRKGWRTGRTGCFEKGHATWNKGKPHPASERSKLTQFKKGGLPHTYRGPGHESICPKDGYTYLIVAEKHPQSGSDTRRVLKHKWLWEQKNGKVPKGFALKALDGNRQNTDPSNWDLIPRGALPHLVAHRGIDYDAAPSELKPAILAIAKLKHARRAKESIAA